MVYLETTSRYVHMSHSPQCAMGMAADANLGIEPHEDKKKWNNGIQRTYLGQDANAAMHSPTMTDQCGTYNPTQSRSSTSSHHFRPSSTVSPLVGCYTPEKRRLHSPTPMQQVSYRE